MASKSVFISEEDYQYLVKLQEALTVTMGTLSYSVILKMAMRSFAKSKGLKMTGEVMNGEDRS